MRRHGDPLPVGCPDCQPGWWREDPDMWSGLSMDMGQYLVLERLREDDDDA